MANSVFITPNGFSNTGTTINPPLPVAFPDGTIGAPAMTFANESSSGWYRAAAGDVRLSVLGADYIQILTSTGQVILNGVNGQTLALNGNGGYYWVSRTRVTSPADGQTLITNNATSAGIGFDAATDGTLKLRGRAYTAGTGNLDVGAKVTAYNQIATAGQGMPSIYSYGDTVAATNTGTASIATYTPAADGTFEVSGNVLITTSTTHSFSLDCTYTDESNVARTLVIPVAQLAGTFVTSGLITNITGAGPYESATMTIRCKAATVITVRTSAGGTFTTVVYNARGVIKQLG